MKPSLKLVDPEPSIEERILAASERCDLLRRELAEAEAELKPMVREYSYAHDYRVPLSAEQAVAHIRRRARG